MVPTLFSALLGQISPLSLKEAFTSVDTEDWGRY